MTITSITAFKKLCPIKRPYTITRNTFTEVEIVFLEIELQNGIRGIGASSTDVNVVGESADDTLSNLRSDSVMELAGKDIRNFLPLIKRFRQQFSSFPGTQAAIDIALHDAFCRWLGMPVVDFYGRYHDKLLTSVTIGIKNVAETLEEAQEYFERNFRALKIKTGLDVKQDAERIIRLREKYRDHFFIRVDANTGYNLQQLQEFMDLTRELDVELIEQPLLPGMENELRKLPPELRARLAADESLKNATSALQLTHHVPYGIFNIKLMKCGGILGAFDIATVARQADISLFWGCNDESIVSITAAVHAAYASPNTRYLDLDGSFDLADDLVKGGFILKDGYILPKNEPGLGVTKL